MTVRDYIAIAAIVVPVILGGFYFMVREIRHLRENELKHIWDSLKGLREELQEHIQWHLGKR